MLTNFSWFALFLMIPANGKTIASISSEFFSINKTILLLKKGARSLDVAIGYKQYMLGIDFFLYFEAPHTGLKK